jgi:hypothetical protein
VISGVELIRKDKENSAPRAKLRLMENRLQAVFQYAVISRVELIRKEKRKFRSAQKIPPGGKRP